MKTTNPLDAARIELLLSELHLSAIKLTWAKLAEQSDKEGWPAARFLAALAEHEIAERGRPRPSWRKCNCNVQPRRSAAHNQQLCLMGSARALFGSA